MSMLHFENKGKLDDLGLKMDTSTLNRFHHRGSHRWQRCSLHHCFWGKITWVARQGIHLKTSYWSAFEGYRCPHPTHRFLCSVGSQEGENGLLGYIQVEWFERINVSKIFAHSLSVDYERTCLIWYGWILRSACERQRTRIILPLSQNLSDRCFSLMIIMGAITHAHRTLNISP